MPPVERNFAIFGIAYFAKVLLPFISGFEIGEYSIQGAAVGNLWDQIIGSAVYLIAGACLLRDGKLLRVALASPALTAFIFLAIVSTAWSVAPEATIRRATGLLGTAIFAGYLACRFTPREVLAITAAGLTLAMGLSIFLVIFVPSYGLMDGTQIGGVYGHKNDLGRAMAFTALACWAVARQPEFNRPAWAVGSLLAAIVLVAISGSAQAVVALILGFAVVLPLVTLCSRWFTKVNLRLGACLVAIAVPLCAFGSSATDTVLALLGRDATLTDRTVIWEILVEFGQDRPLLGYGYAAFWLSDVAFWFIDRWAALDHAHNGYMDLWLELGYVGVGSFLLVILLAGREAWNGFLARPSPATAFFPTFIAIAVVVNSVAHVFPAHNSIYWMLLCYCALIGLGAARAVQNRTLETWAYRRSRARPEASSGIPAHGPELLWRDE